MRISLIYSRINTSTQPPLGLLWIAAVLEKEGHSVQVIDPLPGNFDFLRRIKEFHPDLLGISIMTPEYPYATEIIKKLKTELPSAIFCAGGVHSSALPERTLQELGLDLVVVGEGEYTMREICDRLSRNETIDTVAGIVYKDKTDHIVSTGCRPLIEDLDALPPPARHLIDMEWYLAPPGLIRGAFLKRTPGLMATRGCPYACVFCSSNKIFGRKVRRRSIQNIIKEIKDLLEKYEIDGFYFYDDTFTLDLRYTLEFCAELQNHNIRLKWGCQMRVDSVDEQVLQKMKETGCLQVDLGVESGSDKILHNLKKGFDVKKIKEAFKLIKRAGIRTMATFIIGNPGETLEDIKATKMLARTIKPDYLKFFYLTPFPGSELYEMALANRWIDNSLRFSPQWQVKRVEFPLMTINFSPQELKKIRASLQNSFFLSNYIGYLKEWRFAFLMLFTFLRHLPTFSREIARLARTRRIDSIIELALELYRMDNASRLSSA